MPPPVGNGAVSVAFVRPSVRPSVSYIANNWRIQMPSVTSEFGHATSVPKFGRKVPHLWCHSHTSFKVKRSGWRSQLINAHTHPAPCLPNANLPHTAGWRISRPFPYFCTKLARSILMRDRNIVIEPNFRTSLSKSRILSPKKNSYLPISAV